MVYRIKIGCVVKLVKIRVRITQINIERLPPPPRYVDHYNYDRHVEMERNRPVGRVRFVGESDLGHCESFNTLNAMRHNIMYLTDVDPGEGIPPKKPNASIMRFLK